MRLKQLCVLERVAVMVSDELAIAKMHFSNHYEHKTNNSVSFLRRPLQDNEM